MSLQAVRLQAGEHALNPLAPARTLSHRIRRRALCINRETPRRSCGAALLAALVSLPGCATPLISGQHPQVAPQAEQRAKIPAQASAQRPPPARHIALSSATEHLAQSIRQSGDNARLPFLIIDKVSASVAAYDAQGRLLGVTPALLGSARGDHSVPGIGERPIAKILPH